MAVCKAWSQVLEPILWTDLRLEDHHDRLLSDSSMKAALIRNQPYIRSIKFPASQVSLLHQLIGGSITNPSTRCTGLRRLEFENISPPKSKGVNTFRGFRAPRFWHYSENILDFFSVGLATLLDFNDRLTYLKLPRELFGTKAALAAISKLENLQHLTIASPVACHDDQPISLLLQACLPLPNLTELHFDFDMT
ncbi:hypothetical protein BGZ68_004296 [Mortierella alpina]|nr:hypothetical protein BGZ68_004296 [Mortierella alpina]